MKLKILILPVLLLLSLVAFSQDHNPFKSIGKKGKILTLSKGKYDEFFEKDSLERVGSVIVNRYTRKIEKFLNEDSLYKNTFTKEQSRFLSIDPMAVRFPYYTPYQFAGNTPIWANDLDGLEPNFVHKSDGIYGMGLFDEQEIGKIPRHQATLRVGKEGKQFQIQWLMNNNGEAIGYLASRVIPEEDYKRMYGGSGEGLQPAYLIAMDKFGEFGKNTDKFYDLSRNADVEDVLYGEINRDPVKSLFDPRWWLLGRIVGATGKLSGQLLRTSAILSKAERIAIFQTKLGKASPVGSQADAIKLINKTLDEVEDMYSGVPKAKGIPNRDDGRMYGILDDMYVDDLPDGNKVAKTRNNRIILKKDGGIEIQSKDGSKTYFTKPGEAKKD